MTESVKSILLLGMMSLISITMSLHLYIGNVDPLLLALFMHEGGVMESLQNACLLFAAYSFFKSGRVLNRLNKPVAYLLSTICLISFCREIEIVGDFFHSWARFFLEDNGRLLLLIPLSLYIKRLLYYRQYYLSHWSAYLATYSGVYFLISLLLLVLGWPLDRVKGIMEQPMLFEEALETNAYFLWLIISLRLPKDEKDIIKRIHVKKSVVA